MTRQKLQLDKNIWCHERYLCVTEKLYSSFRNNICYFSQNCIVCVSRRYFFLPISPPFNKSLCQVQWKKWPWFQLVYSPKWKLICCIAPTELGLQDELGLHPVRTTQETENFTAFLAPWNFHYMQFGKLCIYMHCTYKIHKYNLEYISRFCTWVVRNTWNTGAELPRHVDPCPCVGSRVVQDSTVPQRCLLRDLQQDMVNSWSSHTATNRVLKATHQSAPWQLLILIESSV